MEFWYDIFDITYLKVFGIASILNRTGVFSFARYDEAFFDNSVKTNSDIILLRACKVVRKWLN